jgi:hypothetical protein
MLPGWLPSVISYGLLALVATAQLLGPKRALALKTYAKDEPRQSLGRFSRFLVRRAEQGQAVD